MTGTEPRPGDRYRHFKGNFYQVITVAEETETGEKLVIYQALYGDFKVYARPLSLFLSDVDREKYPNANQKKRFELFGPIKSEPAETTVRPRIDMERIKKAPESEQPVREPVLAPRRPIPTFRNHAERSEPVNQSGIVPAAEGDAKPKTEQEAIMYFLDCDTYAEKWDALSVIHEFVSDRMMDTLAAALDIVIPEGDLEDRYAQLRSCISTHKRFETNRL